MSAVSERAAIVALVAASVFRSGGSHASSQDSAIREAIHVAEGITSYAIERHPVEPAEPITRKPK